MARERTREKPSVKGGSPEAIVVRFAGGTVAKLDPGSHRDRTWAEVLESLRGEQAPVYVEIDPKTSYITSLLLPRSFTVTAIREAPEGLAVDLEISHARHYLRRDDPRFEELRRALEAARRKKAPVLVTESLDSSGIVDVRAEDSPCPSPCTAPGSSSTSATRGSAAHAARRLRASPSSIPTTGAGGERTRCAG